MKPTPRKSIERKNLRRFFRSLLALPEYAKKSLDTKLCEELYCKDMDEKEYNLLKEKAATEYKKAIDAIETVWRMSNQQSPPPAPPSTADMIRRALPSFGDKGFTVAEMKDAIETMYPETKGRVRITSVSCTFTRMAKRGDSIRVQRKGSGATAAVYVRLPENTGSLK
jgi:hypothetical protein